jgi:hypothetical protein
LSESGAKKQIYVASVGQYVVLVSNQGGTIRAGDYIVTSSLAGIGMRASADQENVVGKAATSFDGKTAVETTVKNGSKTIAIGRTIVDVGVTHNPYYKPAVVNGVPRLLAQIAGVVSSNRPVSAIRIYGSVILMVVAAAVAGCILYAGVRSSLVAVGRNPMAKHSITRKLLEVTLLSVIIFFVGMIGVYLILRL